MRRKLNIKRVLKPDVNYASLKLSKFTNYIMESGKKNIARGIVFDCMNAIKEKAKVENETEMMSVSNLINNKFLIAQKGKKNYFLITVG
jgi:ribosomal protein S7